MKFSIVAPAFPPQLDGIGDYTAFVAIELAKRHSVQILTATPNPSAIENVSIATVFDAGDPPTIKHIVPAVVANTPDWVLVQYNPFAYGKWGWNPYLVPALRKICKKLPNVRIAVMAHESFVPIINVKFAVMAMWQRFFFWRLGRNIDILFLSIEPWTQKFQRWFPNIPVRHLPVGASLPQADISRDEARRRLGIDEDAFVVGLFGTAHISRPVEWVASAVRRLHQIDPKVSLLYIGPNVDEVRAAMDNDVPVRADGPAPDDEVARRFAAMDLYLCPYTDGVSTRRSAFMAGLMQGVASVSTSGFHTDAVLLDRTDDAYLLTPTERDLFLEGVETLFRDTPRREKMAMAGRRLYEETFDWKSICDRMCGELAAASASAKNGSH